VNHSHLETTATENLDAMMGQHAVFASHFVVFTTQSTAWLLHFSLFGSEQAGKHFC